MPFLSILPHLSSTTTAAMVAGAVVAGSCALVVALVVAVLRVRARARRRYVRLQVIPYRGDDPSAEAIVNMFEALHKRLLRRWWRRLFAGQPSVALEVHHDRQAWLAVTCPVGLEKMAQAALRTAYPNCRLRRAERSPGAPPCVLRLKKHAVFTKRVKLIDRFEHDRAPAMNRLMTAMAACGAQAFVQVALTPTPALFEGHAKRVYKRHEHHLSRMRKLSLPPLDRSMVEDEELKGGLDVQHRPLFFADVRIVGPSRAVCERIASELRAEGAENRLVERGTALRHGVLGLYSGRVSRGEGNPLPSIRRGVFASTELASMWHFPSIGYSTVPFAREPLPLAPASPAILRPTDGTGTLRDEYGRVSIHEQLRRQNTAVPGTVEQGKSSYLVATVAEDLRRERCAVIVLDPKGDAAEAAVSLVGEDRTCTLLDFSQPTCGFNPLAVDAPADTIADYVVQALKNLFTDADIRASSDRYLRNAIIAVLAYDRSCTLWDAARLLSVGEDGYAFRARVGARVRTQPEFKEISEFFTAELSAQLADSRSTTTAKLDAPVNKLARLLNSPSIKRVLLNDSLRVSFDEVIARGEVLVVKGALGAMGGGNTSVLMQLLMGMLDAALARQQDLVTAEQRTAVALKVDEAPLVLNRGFAETMALKRSAGLETVACWQADSQWTDREVRDQLDALFAHRVYFATASVRDARDAASLMMAEFSDTVRPGIRNLSALGRPDVRLHLPKHSAVASWVTPQGRQAPFIARTIPLRVDEQRLAFHAARQAERGGRYRDDLSQPHWERAAAERVGGERIAAERVGGERTAAGRPVGAGVERASADESARGVGEDGSESPGRGGSARGVGEGGGGRPQSAVASSASADAPASSTGASSPTPADAAVSSIGAASQGPAAAAASTDAASSGAADAPASSLGVATPMPADVPASLTGVSSPTPADAAASSTDLSGSTLADAPASSTGASSPTQAGASSPTQADAAASSTGASSSAPAEASGPAPAEAPASSTGVSASSTGVATPAPAEAPASTPAESYRELVDLSAAHSVRWAKPATARLALDPEPLDVEILALIASMRHVLSSQIHRRFNDGRAATTTQRRLKRLSDAGLVARFQFHRRDGGGVPMCYSIAPAGLHLVREHAGSLAHEILRGEGPQQSDPSIPQPNPQSNPQSIPPSNPQPNPQPKNQITGERLLRQARHDVRVTGWALAAERALAERPLGLRGPEESAISPPSHSRSGAGGMVTPADLCLPGGRTPHDFLRTLDSGVRVEVERFQSIRPDATLRAHGGRGLGRDLLVELDDRLPEGVGAAKLERYDHFLAGWSAHCERYSRPGAELPLVVFVCRDRARARECARRADRVLTACRAYAGEYPSDWEYPGRERIVYASERDAHEGLSCAWGVPRLPPDVRVAAADGDPRGRNPLVERRDIRLG